MEEQELAIRCARGDSMAQKELYQQYGSRILALCRRYAADPSDAEDMMQDSFIKIFRVISNFRWTRPGSLYSWMARVTINLAFDSAKRRRMLARQLEDVERLENDIPDESMDGDTASVPMDILMEMIEALPEGYRTVFKLYCIDGLSHKEIADLLGIKEKSSSASLSRARVLLSAAVRQYWHDQDEGLSPEGWTQILRKMRRASARRAVMLTFALLIPAASLLLLHQSRHETGPVMAEIRMIEGNAPSLIIPHQTFYRPDRLKERILSFEEKVSPIPEEPAVLQDEASASPVESPEVADQEITHTYTDLFPALEEERHGARPRISISLRAGSGTSRRNGHVSLESKPYIAALTFMNTVDPETIPDVKSNYQNALLWYANNSFTPNSANTYRHDLPVSLGLSVRLDLNTRMGLESGIEYTYMHSSVESIAGVLDQNLHLIGIPLRFDTRLLSWKGLDLYVGAGAKAEKCIAASLGQVNCEEKRLQWSAGAFAGAQYRIGNRAHLYFQPEFSYCFSYTDLITYRTENPLIFSLNAGIRFDL